MEEMHKFLENVPDKMIAVAIPFYDFVKDHNHIWADNNISPANRLVKSKKVEFRGAWPQEMWHIRTEQVWLDKFRDPRVGRLTNPFCHFGRLKSRKDTARRPEENVRTTPFIGRLPKVMQ